jgi:cytochrome b involved in lipid metabolism
LGGKVYNVTNYIMQHPGGSMTLLNAAGDGKDHIDDFEAEGHSG